MPVQIEEAIDAYLAERKTELSDSSIQNRRYQLKQFRLCAGDAGSVDSIEDIDPINISRFRRSRSADLNSIRCTTNLWCYACSYASHNEWDGHAKKYPIRSCCQHATVAHVMTVSTRCVAAILDTLERYQYASLDHVLLSVM